MIRDEITEEIRSIRHDLAEKLDNDITQIGEDLRRRQHESGRKVLQLPRKQPEATESERRQ